MASLETSSITISNEGSNVGSTMDVISPDQPILVSESNAGPNKVDHSTETSNEDLVDEEPSRSPQRQQKEQTKSSSPSPTTNDAAPPTTLHDQDVVVYGTLNQDLADALALRIQTALSMEVDSLPLLQDGTSKTELRSTLCHKFLRNVDVLEAYSAHNLLTLRNHPPGRRKRIVQVLSTGRRLNLQEFDGDRPIVSLGSNNNNDGNTSSSSSSSSTFRYPTREEIPSMEEVTNLQGEIVQLQEQLQDARARRNELLVEEKSSERAERVANNIVRTLQHVDHASVIGKVQSKVSAAVQSGQTVSDLTLEAEVLSQTLDGMKRTRRQSDGDNDGGMASSPLSDPLWDDLASSSSSMNKSKIPRLSLEETYHRDRSRLGLQLQDSTNSRNNNNVWNQNVSLASIQDTLKVGKSKGGGALG